MNRHARAIVSTGMAFPIGVMLGGTVGAALGDMLFAMLCFIFMPVPITMAVFWRTTRDLDWSWQLERTAYLRVFGAAFLSTGIIIVSMWLWISSQNAALVFLALPIGSMIVTLRTKSALAGVE